MKKITKEELIVRGILLGWVFFVNLVIVLWFPEVAGWPAFLTAIFFFLMGNDVKKIPEIFIGAFMGFVLAVLFGIVLQNLIPIVGIGGAFSIGLFCMLALILLGGAWIPTVLNQVTFAYMTIALIEPGKMGECLTGWIAMLLLGGGILTGGIVLLLKGLAALGEKGKRS